MISNIKPTDLSDYDVLNLFATVRYQAQQFNNRPHEFAIERDGKIIQLSKQNVIDLLKHYGFI